MLHFGMSSSLMPNASDEELAALVQKARAKLHLLNKGPLHSMWDVIFDTESILKREGSICSREEVTNLLRVYVGRAN